MAFAETANLAVKLTLGGNFTSQMSKARASLRGFDKESRGFRAGAQIGTGIKRSAILVVAGITAMAGALGLAIKEGQDAANVQKILAQAITNSGRVSQANVDALNAQATALMNLAGVDDELIKSEQTRLIQMGLTGKQVEKATPLILDFATATGIDLLTATKLFGKAAQGNVGALSRYGVQIDKAKAKVDPFGAAIDAMNSKFGGTTKALSGSFDVRLRALQENLKNIREDVGIKLLPALTRIVDVVGTKLVPAFGKFVDRILPQLNDGLNQFADALSNGGAENAIRDITDALGPMVDLVKIAAEPVKAIVKAFLSLPKEVQTVLVGAFAVNKLTGGLVTNAAGGIIEAIGKGLLGGIKAPLVNVQGGVVNVAGAIPGGGVPGGIGGAAGIGAAAGLSIAGAVTVGGLIAAVNSPLWVKNSALNTKNENAGLTQAERAAQTYYTASAADQAQMRKHILVMPTLADFKSGSIKLSGPPMPRIAQAGSPMAIIDRSSVAVTVNVTASGIKKTVTSQSRYGPAAGSRDDPRFLGAALPGAL